MMQFNKPSRWRWFWSTVGAAFLVYVATVIVVYALALSPDGGVKTNSSNSYIGLLMWDLVFAAPVFMLSFWFITIPLVAAVGAWWAWTHNGNSAPTSSDPTSALDDAKVTPPEGDHEH
ncbi:hypothetical protein A5722_17155 [Mycobacterium vulneris]|uniref:hypothetical protein n=1 Tax=Mycolicibacterium porcinum TaxID=39693 RepID=UPI00080AF498|nr:hypothetical protein A5722_17155 [Mycolicibacterium vulneris]OCB65602.1 hypothetical protein A5729_15990 [Mycolicibacterium vulneris]